MAKAVSLDLLKRFAARIGAVFVKKRSGYDLMSNKDKTKLDGIATGANKYVHPSHTARTKGLYKVTVDGEGHVIGVEAVTKADITGLGIPGQDTNTTYGAATQAAAGLMSAADKKKLDGVEGGANAYSLPAASATERGGVKTGYAANGKNYPVQLSDEKMYVNVPWSDTNTTYAPFKGATASAAGGSGLVPAPGQGVTTKYLRSDGTWQTPPDSNTWRPVQNVLTSTSTTDALSAAQGKALNDRLKVAETLLDAIVAGGTIVLVDETA